MALPLFPVVDVHAHLCSHEFTTDCDALLRDARRAGVAATVAVCEHPREYAATRAIAVRHPHVAVNFGLHPLQPGEQPGTQRSVSQGELPQAISLIEASADAIAGIGEVGLDFSPHVVQDARAKDDQRAVLRAMVELSLRHSLALNVHSRSAGRPTLQLLAECGARRVVMHAFDGSAKVLRTGVELGFHFSVPPTVARLESVEVLASTVPLPQLLIETDAPALAPVKQMRNVPANAALALAHVARLRGAALDEIARATTDNALCLFPKLEMALQSACALCESE